MAQDNLVSLKRRPLTCRMNVHHTWRGFRTEDGGHYNRCIRCGKDHPGASGPTFIGDGGGMF